MAELQTTYATTLASGYAGMIANGKIRQRHIRQKGRKRLAETDIGPAEQGGGGRPGQHNDAIDRMQRHGQAAPG